MLAMYISCCLCIATRKLANANAVSGEIQAKQNVPVKNV